MTKENFTSINVIIDRSGSMGGLRSDTIGGFNTFVTDQKAVPGDVMFSLDIFNEKCTSVHDCLPLNEIPDLTVDTYRPSGSTALLDAVGSTIDRVGAKLASMPEEERPSKVIFVIITDGLENCSRKYTKAQVKEMISHQESVYNWQFIFTGANIDSVSEGSSMGVAAGNSYNYVASASGTRNLYRGLSAGMKSYRLQSSSHVGNSFNSLNNLDQEIKMDVNVATQDSVIIDPTNTPVNIDIVDSNKDSK